MLKRQFLFQPGVDMDGTKDKKRQSVPIIKILQRFFSRRSRSFTIAFTTTCTRPEKKTDLSKAALLFPQHQKHYGERDHFSYPNVREIDIKTAEVWRVSCEIIQ